MVLDSVVDPTVWPGDTTAEAAAFDAALGVFVRTCLDEPSCPLGSDRATVMKRIDDLMTQLNQQPLKAHDGSPVTGWDLAGGLIQALFSEELWQPVQRALGAAFQGETESLVDYLHPDNAEEGNGGDTSPGGAFAVRCLHLRADQRTPEAFDETVGEVNKVAPVFGRSLLLSRDVCTDWPARSLPTAGRALKAAGSSEILLVQNSFDAATPAQWARSVEGQLANARLITNASGGHGFYLKGACTRKVVDDYLLNGTLPARGSVCHDTAPGVATPPSR